MSKFDDSLDALLAQLIAEPSRDKINALRKIPALRLGEALSSNGIAPLLYYQLRQYDLLRETPAHLIDDLRQQAIRADALDLLWKVELTRIINLIATATVDIIILKGAALAYWLYPSPGLRPRTDTDVLIRKADEKRVRKVLTNHGYQLSKPADHNTLNYQFTAISDRGVRHAIDIHLRISNRELFAQSFSFSELLERAVPIPGLCTQAIGLSAEDSLLLACIHRIGHLNEGEGERLIWLYDIHLLVESLTAQQIAQFGTLARQKGLLAVCEDGIEKAREYFHTAIPEKLRSAIAKPSHHEPAAALLKAGPVATLWLQWRAQPTLKKRLLFIRELVFPPSDYMRQKYPASRLWLPLLYLRRAYGGLRKRIGKIRNGA